MTKQEFKEELSKLPKDVLVNYLMEKLQIDLFRKSKELILLEIKIHHNNVLTEKALDDLNNHVSYTGTNIIEWTKNHNDWVKINNHVDKLFAQGEKLRVERDKLNE